MSSRNTTTDKHVGELLSGYIDGELTQQQQQRSNWKNYVRRFAGAA
jgi:hypothetical protein